MTKEEHIERHKLLHQHFDELIADFIGCTKLMPSETTIDVLMKWSHQQTIEPDDKTLEQSKQETTAWIRHGTPTTK